MPRMSGLQGFLIGLALSFSFAWGVGMFVLGIITGLPYIVAAEDVDNSSLYPRKLIDPSSAEELRRELERAGLNRLSGEEQVMTTLRWSMSQTSRTSQSDSKGAWALLASAKRGGGFLCGDLADLYRESLLTLGVPARNVILLRNMFDNLDTHVVVEVWLKGRWTVYDPTFHVKLENMNGEGVDAIAARNWFVRNAGSPVHPRFLGEVTYPARLSTYPLRYESLYNNVFIETDRGAGYPRAIPIIGPLFAPKWLYLPSFGGLSDVPIHLYKGIYLSLFFAIPVMVLVLTSYLLRTRIRIRGNRVS
jgi:hypothetical protein